MSIKRRNAEEAGKLLEQKLNQLLQEAFLQINNLAVIAVWENDNERAAELAKYGKKLSESVKKIPEGRSAPLEFLS